MKERSEKKLKPLLIDCLATGRDNAVKCNTLSKILGCSERDITISINALRKQGIFICSCSDGYYLPLDDEDIKGFVRQMHGRITDMQRAVKPAEDYLKGAE